MRVGGKRAPTALPAGGFGPPSGLDPDVRVRVNLAVMNVDLIALDLDDTLLRSDLTISEANKRALAKARASGLFLVLASGRNVHSMRGYAEELGLVGPGDYMICSNGAEIIHSASGRLLDERRLDSSLCREVSAAIEERGFPWQIYEEGMILVSEPNCWAIQDSRLTGQPTILIEDRRSSSPADSRSSSFLERLSASPPWSATYRPSSAIER